MLYLRLHGMDVKLLRLQQGDNLPRTACVAAPVPRGKMPQQVQDARNHKEQEQQHAQAHITASYIGLQTYLLAPRAANRLVHSSLLTIAV